MILTINDTLIVAGKTNVGCVRHLNEDSLCIDKELGLLIVADGMGGHQSGEKASKQVIETVRASLKAALDTVPQEAIHSAPHQPQDLSGSDDETTLDDIPNPVIAMVRNAANLANTVINDSNRQQSCAEGTGMGSTLVGLWLPPFSEVPVIFHVGDSRLYLFRESRMSQLTQDHSMYQRWVNLGRKGPAPARNILLQAVGPTEHITSDIRFKEMFRGDVVLLCSDGLTSMVSTENIHAVLSIAQEDNLEEVADQLIELAREGGGKDNITVIVGLFIK
ncbi:MAG: serine/threonine-protein phosphatase [Magnetococcales bacterium]|nr:serine/threonine-protein phosphatase [Magnetococcales bacterium]